ncbi:MAG: 3-oxoacyl-ACP reductase FabG [Clostridia bacterium]|nr:3-oxoacyl-ACP reductase FabG [Clostridia bacterium]
MRTVLITGGSRGIGAAMVRLFSENGYSVAFTYKNSTAAAEELARSTGALAIRADSAVPEEIESAVREAEEKIGNIEILINNAAVSAFSLFTDISLEEWRRVLSINLDGAFLYTRAVLSGMINRKCGRIINVASMWGQVGASCEVHYSTAKAALIGMTRALAKELGPSNITVNCISPGVIDTEMNAVLSGEVLSSLAEETPLSRIGKPDEVAAAALFLASDGAAFITGQVLGVNGGYIV